MAAGWYADPHGVTDLLRWWDGEAWTPRTTHDPSSQPPATSDGPPTGAPRGGSALTEVLIPTGSKLVIASAAVLTLTSLAQVIQVADEFGASYSGGTAILEACASLSTLSSSLVLVTALLLKAVRRSSVTGAQKALRAVASIGATVVAGAIIVASGVALGDVTKGGILASAGGFGTGAVILGRLAVLVPALAALWLLAGESVARFAANAQVQLQESDRTDP